MQNFTTRNYINGIIAKISFTQCRQYYYYYKNTDEFWKEIDVEKAENQLCVLIISLPQNSTLYWINSSKTRLRESSPRSLDSLVWLPCILFTMNMNLWNQIQSTPLYAAFFGCFSRHRPVTRHKGLLIINQLL